MLEDIFLKNLPSIDLHGYDAESARVATDDFIDQNIALKNDKFIIIHGKGAGIVKNSVHNVLKSRKEVLNFYTDNYNDGCTIAQINFK